MTIQDSLDNPVGTVDVEFEFAMRGLNRFLRRLSESPHNSDFQKDVCRGLRRAEMLFETKVSPYYGKDYRNGEGGELLLQLGTFAVKILSQYPPNDRRVLDSVNAHLKEIQRIQSSLVNDSLAFND